MTDAYSATREKWFELCGACISGRLRSYSRNYPHEERDATIEKLFVSGKSGQEIATGFNLSRERIRQILERRGVNSKDGGFTKTLADRRRDHDQKRDALYLDRWGCTFKQYRSIPRKGRDKKSPTYAYHNQRQSARRDGTAWNLTLWQWWTIWKDSGKWEERGRGKYVLGRLDKTGQFCVDNVAVMTFAELRRVSE